MTTVIGIPLPGVRVTMPTVRDYPGIHISRPQPKPNSAPKKV